MKAEANHDDLWRAWEDANPERRPPLEAIWEKHAGYAEARDGAQAEADQLPRLEEQIRAEVAAFDADEALRQTLTEVRLAAIVGRVARAAVELVGWL